MNTKKALEILRETSEWLYNMQDHDATTRNVLSEVRPEGTGFVLISSAIFVLEEHEHQLAASLRTLLDWCERFLIDDKHLIGSVCKEADDAQFRMAIELAKKALENN